MIICHAYRGSKGEKIGTIFKLATACIEESPGKDKRRQYVWIKDDLCLFCLKSVDLSLSLGLTGALISRELLRLERSNRLLETQLSTFLVASDTMRTNCEFFKYKFLKKSLERLFLYFMYLYYFRNNFLTIMHCHLPYVNNALSKIAPYHYALSLTLRH